MIVTKEMLLNGIYIFMTFKHSLTTLSNTYNQTDVPLTSFVRGLSSGATGYLAASTGNTYKLSLKLVNFLIW